MNSEKNSGHGALAGKTLLVTGAAGGLGQALSLAAAKAGAQLILLGRRVRKLNRIYDAIVEAGGAEPALYPMDLAGASPDDYSQLADNIRQGCGALDAIVHCAAEFKGLTSLENAPLEDWFTGLHVNLTAPMLLTRACLPLLRQAEGEAVVLFLLDDADQTTRAYWGAYGVAKQALRGLIPIWHSELSNSGIRLQGAVPGPMRTSLRSRAFFANDPGSFPPPDIWTADLLALLDGSHARRDDLFVQLEAEPQQAEATGPRKLGLNVLQSG